MNYLHSLITDHIRSLSGAEFKIAAYAYRRLESQEQITCKIGELADATGVSWRQAQSALKRLRERGILDVDSTPGRGTCCRLPDAVKAKAKVPGPEKKPAARARQKPGLPEVVPPQSEHKHKDDQAEVRLAEPQDPVRAKDVATPPADLSGPGLAGSGTESGIPQPKSPQPPAIRKPADGAPALQPRRPATATPTITPPLPLPTAENHTVPVPPPPSEPDMATRLSDLYEKLHAPKDKHLRKSK